MTGAWRDLRFCFFESLARAPDDGQSHWRRLVEHPWYQAELRRAADRAIGRAAAPADLADDVMQEALLLLARELRRAPDLGLQRDAPEEVFPRWLRTIIARHCRESLRGLRRPTNGDVPLCEARHTVDDRSLMDMRLDFHEAVRALPERERITLLLHARGWAVAEIAHKAEQPYHTVYSLWRRACRRVQRELGDEPER